MKKRGKTIACLDIGSSEVRILLAREIPNSAGESALQILGLASGPSYGLRKGVIADTDEVSRAIRVTTNKLIRETGAEINWVVLGLDGPHLSTASSTGTIAVSTASEKISADDVQRVFEQAKNMLPRKNNQLVIEVLPQFYKVDGEISIEPPIGLFGKRLEAEVLIIENSAPAMEKIDKSVLNAGLKVSGKIISTLASGQSVLTKRQKELGVVIIDIGAGVTGIAVYEEGRILQLKNLAIGGAHITNDVAIGLKLPVEVAEKIKIKYGQATEEGIRKEALIDLSKIDESEKNQISQYKLTEIIEARLFEIFTLINKELKSIGRQKLLPAGAVITGGVAKTRHIAELAKNVLELPAKIGLPFPQDGILNEPGPELATILGLAIMAFEENANINNSGGILETAKELLKKFIP